MELFIELMDGFGPILTIGLLIVAVIISAACILAGSVFGPLLAHIKNDDVFHMLKNRLPNLKGWLPTQAEINEFFEKKIRSKKLSGLKMRCTSAKMQDFICYALAFGQEESSLVTGIAEYGKQRFAVLWFRFYWEDQWWVLWHGGKKGRTPKFRAFPECQLEDEVWPEVGNIVAFWTISYEEVDDFF